MSEPQEAQARIAQLEGALEPARDQIDTLLKWIVNDWKWSQEDYDKVNEVRSRLEALFPATSSLSGREGGDVKPYPMEQQELDRQRRVVIRDGDYYGGDIYVTGFPLWGMDLCELRIVWEAYQGGAATLVLQDVKELRALAAVLIEAADTIDPDREEA